MGFEVLWLPNVIDMFLVGVYNFWMFLLSSRLQGRLCQTKLTNLLSWIKIIKKIFEPYLSWRPFLKNIYDVYASHQKNEPFIQLLTIWTLLSCGIAVNCQNIKGILFLKVCRFRWLSIYFMSEFLETSWYIGTFANLRLLCSSLWIILNTRNLLIINL